MKKILLMSTILAGMFSMQAHATVYDTYAGLLGTNTVLSIGDQTVTVTGASLTQNLNRILANQPGIAEEAAMNRAIGHQMWRVARHQLDTRDRTIVNNLAAQARTIASDVADAFADTSFGGAAAGDPADTWGPWVPQTQVFFRPPDTYVNGATTWYALPNVASTVDLITQQGLIARTVTEHGTFWNFTDTRRVVVNGDRDATPPAGSNTRERREVITAPGNTYIDNIAVSRTIPNPSYNPALPPDTWTEWVSDGGITLTRTPHRRETRREGSFDVYYDIVPDRTTHTTFTRNRIVNGGHDGGPDVETRVEITIAVPAHNFEISRTRVLWQSVSNNYGRGTRATNRRELRELADRYHDSGNTPWVTNGVARAWRDGWDGTGIDIGIVDTFTGSEADPHGIKVKGIAIGTHTDPGVAPGATFHQFQWGTNAFGLNPNFGRDTGGYFNSRPAEVDIFNHSYETTIPGHNYNNLREIKRQLLDAGRIQNQYKGSDVLNIYAAGNRASNCGAVRECNLFAVQGTALGNVTASAGPDGPVYNYTRDPNNTAIVVGAAGGHFITRYSNRGGILAEDFITAEGTGGHWSSNGIWPGNCASWFCGDRGGSNGTSFAAPRVTGVAALIMHKFKTDALTTKNILLQTADGQATCANVPKTTRCVDINHGHGKLNAAAALSPVGILR